MNKTERLVRANIRALAPYSTARDEYTGDIGTYLDANENPYENGFNRYPDPYQRALKERLSEIKSIPAGNIFIGNGSDEAIDLAYRVFCEPRVDNAIMIAPSYGMYSVAAGMNDVEVRQVMLRADFSVDTDALLAAADANSKLMLICSPNNPSGNSIPEADIVRLLEGFGGMVVLDEAYIDFSSHPSMLERIEEFPNLIILQTLSKAWGMAGLRLGLAFADKYVIDLFTKVKYPYNINVVTQKIVLELLSTDIAPQISEIIEERELVAKEFAKMRVIKKIFPSDANFILVRVDEPRKIYNLLIEQGIIVRDRSRIAGCEGCLRITIGTPTENRRLIEVLKTV